ncbi:MAG: hypothetical protein MJ101_06525, partial [Clostridia bacterium]|nr:hypothetical protein [Clostridia bacterium]
YDRTDHSRDDSGNDRTDNSRDDSGNDRQTTAATTAATTEQTTVAATQKNDLFTLPGCGSVMYSTAALVCAVALIGTIAFGKRKNK